MQSVKSIVLIALLISLLVRAEQANATIIYGVTGAANALSSLYTYNTSTNTTTLIGSTGLRGLAGIDFHPISGVLYAVTGVESTSLHRLYQLNTTTGAATPIGFGTPDGADITFTPNGTLWAYTPHDSNVGDDIKTINLTTGVETPDPTPSYHFHQTGLAANSAGVIYQNNGGSMWIVDPAANSLSFQFNISNVSQTNLLDFDPVSNVLYGGSRPNGSSTRLHTINLSTGVGTTVGTANVAFSGIAIASTPAVPEPATLAIWSLGAIGCAVVASRRKKQVAERAAL